MPERLAKKPSFEKLSPETMKFMYEDGSRLLHEFNISSEETLDFSFYKPGNKGYWFALFVQHVGDDLSRRKIDEADKWGKLYAEFEVFLKAFNAINLYCEEKGGLSGLQGTAGLKALVKAADEAGQGAHGLFWCIAEYPGMLDLVRKFGLFPFTHVAKEAGIKSEAVFAFMGNFPELVKNESDVAYVSGKVIQFVNASLKRRNVQGYDLLDEIDSLKKFEKEIHLYGFEAFLELQSDVNIAHFIKEKSESWSGWLVSPSEILPLLLGVSKIAGKYTSAVFHALETAKSEGILNELLKKKPLLSVAGDFAEIIASGYSGKPFMLAESLIVLGDSFKKFGSDVFVEIAHNSGHYTEAVFWALGAFGHLAPDEKSFREFASSLQGAMKESSLDPVVATDLFFDVYHHFKQQDKPPWKISKISDAEKICKSLAGIQSKMLGSSWSIVYFHMAVQKLLRYPEKTYSQSFPELYKNLESGRILPPELSRVSMVYLDEKVNNYYTIYEDAIGWARMLGSGAEEGFLASLDLSLLAEQTKTRNDAVFVLNHLLNIHPRLPGIFLEKVEIKKEWVEFSHDHIDESNIGEAVEVISLLSAMHKYSPESKEYAAAFVSLKDKFLAMPIQLPPINSREQLESVVSLVNALTELDAELGERFKKDALKNFDFLAITRSVSSSERLDPEKLERVRLDLNRIDRVYGDEFILSLGIFLSSWEITRERFFERLEEVENCFFSEPSKYKDVNQLYELVGRFQANSLAKFLLDNRGSFSKEDFEKASEALGYMGLDVSLPDSSFSKALRSLSQGQFGYFAGKVVSKLDSIASNEVFDPKYSNAELVSADALRMPSGFSCRKYYLGEIKAENEFATVISGDFSKGARVAFKVGVGEGISGPELEARMGSGLVAIAVGAFSAGEKKLASFGVENGKIVSFFLKTDLHGLALIYPDGSLDIAGLPFLNKSDIVSGDYEMGDTPLNIWNDSGDFSIFVHKLERSGASAFQMSLLLYEIDGDVKNLVPPTSESTEAKIRDKRRFLAVMKDGSFALIDFTPHLTFFEAASFARQMGVKSMVYLDTGYYDYSSFYDASGVRHPLGIQDKVNPSNVVVFFKAPAGKIKK